MAECDVLKVEFFPEKTPFSSVSATDYLKQTAAVMLFHLINKKTQVIIPLHFGPPILNAFEEVASMLDRATQTPHQFKQTCK